LPSATAHALYSDDTALRILFVSHYTYYRNFETLLRAMPALRERLGSRKVKLFLTCRFRPGENPGSYRTESASVLIRQLGIVDQVVELGAIPYYSLHHVYRACDIYATAAYAETFAHPLVEAMSSSLPVVASDSPVHREICGEAALYFQRFASDELADRIIEIASSSEVASRLAERGTERARNFSWSKHVDRLLSLAGQLLNRKAGSTQEPQIRFVR
jgi:glycosyltransferase involved in cell wall biosynthesis